VRERERVRLTGGARRQRESGGRDEGARVVGPSRAREGGGGSGPESAQPRRGERVFLFLFIFSLIPFLFYTNIHLCFLGAKMKY
jgi:hypothetical protein